jgi:hypothetical protein
MQLAGSIVTVQVQAELHGSVLSNIEYRWMWQQEEAHIVGSSINRTTSSYCDSRRLDKPCSTGPSVPDHGHALPV